MSALQVEREYINLNALQVDMGSVVSSLQSLSRRGGRGVLVENRSEVELHIRDRYIMYATTGEDRAGVLDFIIPSHGQLRIPYFVFTKELAQDPRYTQKIVVSREDGQVVQLLTLFHDEFDSNDGSSLVLEQGGDPTDFSYKFVPGLDARKQKSLYIANIS